MTAKDLLIMLETLGEEELSLPIHVGTEDESEPADGLLVVKDNDTRFVLVSKEKGDADKTQ